MASEILVVVPVVVKKISYKPRIHYCDECNASSETTDILRSVHFQGQNLCDDCIEADDELSGYKWE
jgi:hypothetical protein